MMNLRSLTNEDLDCSLKKLITQERELLSSILSHIGEVDRRKLYLKMAYPNLFAYLTEHLGYSAGSAQRRIDAARLLSDVPDLTEKLESGSLNLAQVSCLQKAIRQKSKESSVKISNQDKQTLIGELLGKSLEQSQHIIAETLDLEIKTSAKTQIQKDDSVRLEITLSKEQWEKLNRMRELLSTSLPHGSWDEVLEYVADKVIAQKTKTPLKRAILQRDQCCQHIDTKTNRQCGSKWNLQVDHIHPKWDGGNDKPTNLRVLCANHNRQRYKEQAGIH